MRASPYRAQFGNVTLTRVWLALGAQLRLCIAWTLNVSWSFIARVEIAYSFKNKVRLLLLLVISSTNSWLSINCLSWMLKF